MFTDKVTITVTSGKGGDGHVSFRREKYVPNGGPDGGDGGNGGSVILRVDKGMNTLSGFKYRKEYKAGNGEDGKKKRMAGKKGEDLILSVPEGTVVREEESGQIIVDMSGETQEYTLLKGGRGGIGNMHFATSTMQAPKYAKPGQPARTLSLVLELKLIADVGLVGFPNAGKSTLLSVATNAKPKIASYPFTTLQPMLGVVDLGDENSFVMADIPGLIEGAAEGAGLGHAFLAHIERTRILIHVVDVAGTEGRDPLEDIRAINKELERYRIDLSEKKQIIAANKADLIPADSDSLVQLKEEWEKQGVPVFLISAATGEGVKDLMSAAWSLLQTLPAVTDRYEQEFDPEKALYFKEEPLSIGYDAKEKVFYVEGPRIEKMLGYTNLDTEKGFLFFQKFVEETGINDRLRELGAKEGDTVRMYGHAFTFYE